MSLRVIQPGLLTMVVDLGRPASRSLGVPVGGAADRFSLMIGNALVGNDPAAAALEINLVGPTLEATCDLGCVLSGAPFAVSTEHRELEPGTTFTLKQGETLRIGGGAGGARAYLCVRGGIGSTTILGSRSALDPLKAGDELTCRAGVIAPRFVRVEDESNPFTAIRSGLARLRVLPGPQADWFAGRQIETRFRVSPASNRMGLRLEGSALPWPGRELVSEPVCPGSVQVTRDGGCIILGVDGQTIGGYPKIAQVISADLDIVGQLRPGDEIEFVPVSLSEAERLAALRRSLLRLWMMRLSVTTGRT